MKRTGLLSFLIIFIGIVFIARLFYLQILNNSYNSPLLNNSAVKVMYDYPERGYIFDETRGFKFISYAVWWLRQSILQALAEQSRIVRLPLNKIGSINKINKMYAFLEQENERPPSA